MNERLQYDLHPWTSYVIVPLFALANAGVHLTGRLLSDAASLSDHARDPGRVPGRKAGRDRRPARGSPRGRRCTGRARRSAARCIVGRRRRRRASGSRSRCWSRAWPSRGLRLEEAKLGTLATVVARAGRSTWVAVTRPRHLPHERPRAPDRPHGRGHPRSGLGRRPRARPHSRAPTTRRSRWSSTATSVPVLRAGRADDPRAARRQGGDVRYVWRHLPLNDVHPNAQLAAEASEAAAAQGRFWEMYDTLLSHQDELTPARPGPLRRRSSGSTPSASGTSCAAACTPPRVAEDVASADESGVSGTPTFFINGRRHYGVYDIDALTRRSRPPRKGPVSSRSPAPEPRGPGARLRPPSVDHRRRACRRRSCGRHRRRPRR